MIFFPISNNSHFNTACCISTIHSRSSNCALGDLRHKEMAFCLIVMSSWYSLSLLACCVLYICPRYWAQATSTRKCTQAREYERKSESDASLVLPICKQFSNGYANSEKQEQRSTGHTQCNARPIVTLRRFRLYCPITVCVPMYVCVLMFVCVFISSKVQSMRYCVLDWIFYVRHLRLSMFVVVR